MNHPIWKAALTIALLAPMAAQAQSGPGDSACDVENAVLTVGHERLLRRLDLVGADNCTHSGLPPIIRSEPRTR